MLETWHKMMALLNRRERIRFRLLLGLMLLTGVANMVGVASIIPFLAVLARPEMVETNSWLAWAFDLSGFEAPQSFLIALGAAVFIAYIGAIAVRGLTTYATIRFAAMRNFSLSYSLMSGYLGQPYYWFLGRHSSDLVRTSLHEVQRAVLGVMLPFLHVFSNGAVLVGMIFLIVMVNPAASFIMLLGVGGLYLLIFAAVRRRITRLGREGFTANQMRYRIAQEALGGAKEVKVMGLEAKMIARFRRPALTYARTMATSGLLSDVPRHLLEGAAFGGLLAVLLMLMALEQGNLAAVLPVAGVYALAGARMLPAMQQVYTHFNNLRFSKPSLDALHADLLEARAVPALPPSPADPLHLRERLELRDVHYSYPAADRPALKGLSLDIPVNSTVGIVGGTGAGKTTAMDLILGLLVPQKGALVVDGRPVADEAARRAWRRSLGYVPQQIFLMDESVAANIAFGDEPHEIDHQAVERAARMANLHDFVVGELPEGYATKVGDRGIRLSGGQRQRIGIARALYRDPDVLILDEATSALDNLTERAVMEAVGALGGAKTIIVVAHRLTTVQPCDEIFLLENGRLLSRGTYDELVERDPLFREMARGVA